PRTRPGIAAEGVAGACDTTACRGGAQRLSYTRWLPRQLAAGEVEPVELGVAELCGLGVDLGGGAVEGGAGGVDVAGGGEDLGAPAVDVLGAVGAGALEALDGVVDAGDGFVVAAEAGQGEALDGEAVDDADEHRHLARPL